MAEGVRWVTKVEAARELEVSISTLDRMIRKGEVDVLRDGRRVYVQLEGPEYVSDDDLLRRSLVREDKLQRTVWDLDGRASELERERDEASLASSASGRAYEEMEEAYWKERAAHGKTSRWILRLGLTVVALIVICGLLTWRLVA